ncbi:hypothetical protein ACFYUK_14445 [Nonomuraea wenchangensis]
MPDSPDPTDPPSPSLRNALTVNPTFCPAALAGTASTALHDPPLHALSAASRPTTPDCVLDTWYVCRSGSAPLLQVTTTFVVPWRSALTLLGVSAGRRSLKVLLSYLVPVISPLRVTVKVPFGALPASNVPEMVWLAPPPATFTEPVDGPSTYSPMRSCISPVRAEMVTDDPETTCPSDGEVICPEAPLPTVTAA